MNFMNCINMVPNWVACFWCLIAGFAVRGLISDVREISRHLKAARVPVGEIVIRRLTPAAPSHEPAANEPDNLQDGKDNPRKPFCKGDENAKRSKKLHVSHYTISLTAALCAAAISGCYSIRDFREWSDHHDRMTSMLINSYNNIQKRVETLETDVDYLNRHAMPFNLNNKPFKNACRSSDAERAEFRSERSKGRFRGAGER